MARLECWITLITNGREVRSSESRTILTSRGFERVYMAIIRLINRKHQPALIPFCGFANFFSRYPDMSQDIDRHSSSGAWGITGCLTPGGLPYSTSRGGPIVGYESLSLQGIPIGVAAPGVTAH